MLTLRWLKPLQKSFRTLKTINHGLGNFMNPIFKPIFSIFEPPKARIMPKLRNDTGKTLIQTVSKSSFTPSNSYIITSMDGTVIVADPTAMPTEDELDLRPDVITVTHPHSDHIDPDFLDRHNCRKSISRVESFDVADVHIYSVGSSHRGSHISVKSPSNVIYVFEVDGLRIAHMGDIGQDHLTVKQLESLEGSMLHSCSFPIHSQECSIQRRVSTLLRSLSPRSLSPPIQIRVQPVKSVKCLVNWRFLRTASLSALTIWLVGRGRLFG